MTVFVDYIGDYPNEAIKPAALRYGNRWSHLWSNDLAELHQFARNINLRADWFQDRPRFPHYDIVPSARLRALEAGAQVLTIGKWLNESHEALRPQADIILAIVSRYHEVFEPGDMLSLSRATEIISTVGLRFGALSSEERALLAAYEGYASCQAAGLLRVTLYPTFGVKR